MTDVPMEMGCDHDGDCEPPACPGPQERPMMQLEPLTPEEVTTLARRIVTNEVYVAWTPEMMISFESILMLSGLRREEAEQVGLIWEEYSAAAPRSINGYPCFLSMRFVHVDSVRPLVHECKRMSEALGLPTDG